MHGLETLSSAFLNIDFMVYTLLCLALARQHVASMPANTGLGSQFLSAA